MEKFADFENFEINMLDCIRQIGYEPDESSYSLEAPDFRTYRSRLGCIHAVWSCPGIIQARMSSPDLTELDHVDYRNLYERHQEFYKTVFPQYVRKFRADNKFWEQIDLAYSNPDAYMPSSGVLSVRMRNQNDRARHPIVHKSKLYTSGLDHFLLMWGHAWERDFNEKAMDPEALRMLVALQSINDKSHTNDHDIPVQLIPFEISPDGKLFLGGLQTDAFLPWDGDCLWLQAFEDSPDDLRIV